MARITPITLHDLAMALQHQGRALRIVKLPSGIYLNMDRMAYVEISDTALFGRQMRIHFAEGPGYEEGDATLYLEDRDAQAMGKLLDLLAIDVGDFAEGR